VSGRLRLLLVAAVLLGAGCGGGDPDYCSDVSDLEQSVKDLGSVDVVEGGRSAVTEALDEVEGNARAAVDSAKSDFPDETDAVTKSISDLKKSAGEFADSPTPQQGARVAADVGVVASAVEDFVDATRSECD
jgi:ElaB/YqjD/DUF883 family membrane-anchored ribosome-binding protein